MTRTWPRRVRLHVERLEDRLVPVIYTAGPTDDYQSMLNALNAGDTLRLTAGDYDPLVISNRQGSSPAWITLESLDPGNPARILGNGNANTIDITNSWYVAIRNLEIDSQGFDGADGIKAGGGTGNLVHDILIEGNTILNTDGSQQTVGISTKTITWNWTIRNNRIINSGTGMYLGDSDGSDQFVAGLIEGNYIENTIGYCVQIKVQLDRPQSEIYVPYYNAGLPAGPSSTIIRNNVFNKGTRFTPGEERPSVLVGGFSTTGPGSLDLYQIYGNFFYGNPRENLLQATGRVSIHDNIFVNGSFAAGTSGFAGIRLQTHDGRLVTLAHVYNNTVYVTDPTATGISVGSGSTGVQVVGNLVFAATPLFGVPVGTNFVDSIANAGIYVTSPSTTLGSMNFYPRTGSPTSPAQGTALELTPFAGQADYNLDFNLQPKGGQTFRGAYAGAGVNPGWQLQAGPKTFPPPPPPPGNRTVRSALPNPAIRPLPRATRPTAATGAATMLLLSAGSPATGVSWTSVLRQRLDRLFASDLADDEPVRPTCAVLHKFFAGVGSDRW